MHQNGQSDFDVTYYKLNLAIDPDQLYEGNWASLIGLPVNVTVVINKKDDKVYENVGAITSMRAKDAEKCPELVNPTKVFDLDAPNMEVFNAIPEWIQNIMKENLEFNGSKLQAALNGEEVEPEQELDDEVPF